MFFEGLLLNLWLLLCLFGHIASFVTLFFIFKIQKVVHPFHFTGSQFIRIQNLNNGLF